MNIELSADSSTLQQQFAAAAKSFNQLANAMQQQGKHAKDASDKAAGLGKAWDSTKRVISGATQGIAAGAGVVAASWVTAGVTIARVMDQASAKMDQLGDSSKRNRIPVEELSALKFAAEEAGVGFSNLDGMLGKALTNIGRIAEKSGSMQVGKLNIALRDSQGQMRSISSLLPEIANGIQSLGSAAEQHSVATKIFGKEGGAQFVQLLQDGGDFMQNLAAQTEKANRLGVVFTQQQVDRLQSYRDSVERVSAAWDGVKVKVASELAPELTKLMDGLSERVAKLPSLLKVVTNGISADAKPQDIEKVNKIFEAGVNVLVVGAREAAYAFAVIAGKALITAAEFGADALAAQFVKVGLGGSTRVGDENKLADFQKQLGELTKILEAMNSGQTFYDDSLYGRGQIGVVAQRRMNEVRPGLVDIESAIRELEIKIKQQESMLGMNRPLRDADVAKSVSATTSYLDSLQADVGTELKDSLDRLKVSLLELGKVVDETAGKMPAARLPMGPPLPDGYGPRAGTNRDVLKFMGIDGLAKGFEDQWNKIKAFAEGPVVSSVWEGLKQQGERAVEVWKAGGKISDLADQVKRIRFEIYPEEKRQAELEAFEKLVEAVKAMKASAIAEVRELAETIPMDDKLAEDKRKQILEAGKESLEKTKTLSEAMSDQIKGFSGDAASEFVDMAFGAKKSFGEILEGWTKTLASMALKYMVFAPIFNSLGQSFSGLTNNTAVGNIPTDIPIAGKRANGGPVDFGNTYLVGERGPELFKPGSSGMIIPNHALRGGGGVDVQIYDQRSSGARPSVQTSTGPDGRTQVRILVRDAVKEMLSNGSLDGVMRDSYGATRRGR